MKVENLSKLQTEKAKKQKCPRCSGFGSIAFTDDNGVCPLCNGYGYLWMSVTGSGWTRALYSKKSKLYWGGYMKNFIIRKGSNGANQPMTEEDAKPWNLNTKCSLTLMKQQR